MGDEDFLDLIGMMKKEDGAMKKTDLDHVAVIAGTLDKKIESILSKMWKMSTDPVPFGPGRNALLNHIRQAPQ